MLFAVGTFILTFFLKSNYLTSPLYAIIFKQNLRFKELASADWIQDKSEQNVTVYHALIDYNGTPCYAIKFINKNRYSVHIKLVPDFTGNEVAKQNFDYKNDFIIPPGVSYPDDYLMYKNKTIVQSQQSYSLKSNFILKP